MNKIERKLKYIIAGLLVVIVLLIGLLVKNTVFSEKMTIVYDTGMLEVNHNFKQEVSGNITYIYVPINTDMLQTEVKVKQADGSIVLAPEVEIFFKNLNTLVPGERVQTFHINGVEITLSVIVQ